MANYDDIARRYIDSWNDTDPSARRAKVTELYTEDARYIDPLAQAEGRDAIEATIAAVHPGLRVLPGGSRRRAPQPGPVRLGTRTGR